MMQIFIRQLLIMMMIILGFHSFLEDSFSEESQIDSLSLFQMELEELMEIRIGPSSITSLDFGNDPACVTVITAKDIALTPSRTFLDILEVYVPGATYVDHFKGPRFGFRGILGDQNYSYLLLVNGVNMNLISSDGPLFEITNKDLDDIERIEIARGPGSVTYGPGAIGGVINIITKNGQDSSGTVLSTKYDPSYRYHNYGIATSLHIGEGTLYFNGSMSRSTGMDDTKFFYVDRAHGYGYGFMGDSWGNQGLGSPAPHIFDDYYDHPEIKINLNYIPNDNWNIWTRFSTFNQTMLVQESTSLDGNIYPGRYGSSFLAVMENKTVLKENIKLTSRANISSKSIRELLFYNRANESYDHVTQRNASYSENILSVNSILNYYHSDRLEIAGGSEFSYQYWGPQWGQDKSEFVMNFQPPIRFGVLDKNSEFLQTFPGYSTYINGKIDGSMFSLFGEMNWVAYEKGTLLVSSRMDKHTYSDWAISPRVALLNEVADKQYVKAIWQRSVRLPSYSDLFSADKINRSSSKPEVIEGFEAIYSGNMYKNLNLQFSTYYQTVNQIAWRGDLEHPDEVGKFDLFGVETELTYCDDYTRMGINATYINQLDWNPVFADVAYITHTDDNTTYLVNTGENRINNLPENMIKVFINRSLPHNITFHVNGRFYWNYGQEDMLEMFMDAHQSEGTSESKTEMRGIYDTLLDEGYTKPSFTSNIALSGEYALGNVNLRLNVFALNVVSVNHIRYVIQYWETGNLRQYPRQCGFVEEPLTVGCKINVKF